MAVDVVVQTKSFMEFHEVANIFPLIEGQEFDDLVEDIRANGLKQPIWAYQGKIVDGRNRYKACLAANVTPRFQEWDGNGSLVTFTISLNVKRRHLTSSQLGAISLAVEKQLALEAKERQGTRTDLNIPQNFAECSPGEARDQTAELLGTNHTYVSEAKKIERQAPELIEHVINGTLTIPDAKAIAVMPQERREVIIEKVVQRKEEEGKRVSRAVKEVIWEEDIKGEETMAVKSFALSALQSSESNEWYTPIEYVDAARELMGGVINIDPASCELANKTVNAENIYTFDDSGLHHDWTGHVWLNPPYGFTEAKSNQEIWTQKLIEQYEDGPTTEAVLLVNANTEAKWFRPLYKYLICLTDHRIRFYNNDGESSQPTQGNAFAYFGSQRKRFIELFSRFGTVVERARIDE